jgi:hypothetical protein
MMLSAPAISVSSGYTTLKSVMPLLHYHPNCFAKKSNVLPAATITREIIASKWFEVCGLISVLISIESAKSTRP